MAKNVATRSHSLSFPAIASITFAILGAIVVAASFEIIKYWPQPQSVEPYFDAMTGAVWGFVAGGVFGFIIGYLTDDDHFRKDETAKAPADKAVAK